MKEIRIHGRERQRIVVTSEILVSASLKDGKMKLRSHFFKEKAMK